MNNNVRFALFFALAIIVWFASGIFKTVDSAEPVTEATKNYTKVQVASFKQQLFSRTLSLRAKTEPNRVVNVLAQVPGKISAGLVQEGSPVEKGQGICQIDAEDRHLRLAEAQASLDNANIAYRGAIKLKSVGYQSELAISKAKAVLASARAQLKRAQLDVENLQIKAPFAGIVESRPVEIGDFIMPGQLCAKVVELHPLKIEALVTESEISRLVLGDEAVVVIAGETYSGAKVSYLAHQADAMTKGFRLEALMDNTDQSIRAGASAQLDIQIAPVLAQLIPASSILLGDLGNTIVRVLGPDQIVASAVVTAIGEVEAGVWVTGLPEEVVVVTVGQNYIIDGERVEPSFSVSSLK